MAYTRYDNAGGGRLRSNDPGFDDSFDFGVGDSFGISSSRPQAGYADSYSSSRPYGNGRADPFARNGGDPFSSKFDEPLYAGRDRPNPYSTGRRDFEDHYPSSRARPIIEDDDAVLANNPYIRNNVRQPDLNRNSAAFRLGSPELRRGHHRTDSFDTSISSAPVEPVYMRAMNRNSGLMTRAPPAIYTLDHLATFTVSQKQRLLTPEDGMHQLRRMEKTTGVWTMRVELRIDEREIVVTETATQKEIESFPISSVISPVAIQSDDKEDVYNNIVIFTVQAYGSGSAAEMNVFQCIGVSAQEVVDDIEAARTGRFPRPPKKPAVTPKPEMRESPPLTQSRPPSQPPAIQKPLQQANDYEPTPPPQPVNAEKQKEVENLNKCLDDIERFVTDIQKAAAANKSYEKKKAEGASQAELDYYKQRASPPSTEEYVTILQKFKYAFNLLPKLEDVLKDPDAPELIKMLFNPLTVILNSSRDPSGKLKLAESVTSPLLTLAACRLMDKNLTPKDVELWQSIGDSWKIPEERWQGPPVSPYIPEFTGGRPSVVGPPPSINASSTNNGEPLEPQQIFLNELKSRNCKICQVMTSRTAATNKELTVTAGEYLEIINDEKNWWKVENIRNESGYAPKTLLNKIQ